MCKPMLPHLQSLVRATAQIAARLGTAEQHKRGGRAPTMKDDPNLAAVAPGVGRQPVK
jgi:hypothetical protein